ncbi:type VII secretion protein EccB [Saccharopolyspora rosea]|uniref:Type VII secretion protein EccB n=1 Tax=Saccharopolyspora rosea TaxID=524884 RepID=A0ABW3FRH9_9PSEU|nr:type VII secretion protein EccB [Saccharopolyspora rosea]
MQTQRDHVHAYQFLMDRLSSALVLGDPASAEVPARRARVGLTIGLVLAVLISIGFGVYGLLVPGGNTSWQRAGSIVVEKETGTRFVNLGGVLHPTPNYASAKLLAGPRNSGVTLVSSASLEGARRGAPLGIPDAPQTLPPAQQLAGSRWLVCLSGSGGLGFDFDPAAPARPLPADRYSLVESPDGARYLLFRGAKYRVSDPAVLAALGMATARPATAPQPWLNAVPDGPALVPATIDGAGSPGPAVDGHPGKVGQLFEQQAANGEVESFVLRKDGLAPVSGTERMLLEAAPGASEPVRIDAAAVAAAPHSADRSLTQRLPDLSGARYQGGDGLCLRQTPSGTRVDSQVVTTSRPATGVQLRPGTAALVAAMPIPPGRRIPDRYLVADGAKYLVPDDDSLRALGFAGAPIHPIANELLAAMPTGPVLSRAAVGASQEG